MPACQIWSMWRKDFASITENRVTAGCISVVGRLLSMRVKCSSPPGPKKAQLLKKKAQGELIQTKRDFY